MKYCCNSLNADEYRYRYRREDLNLPEFVAYHCNMPIVIDAHRYINFDAIEIERFNALAETYQNIKVILTPAQIAKCGNDCNFPIISSRIATTFEDIEVLAQNPNITDVYISDEIAFMIPKLREFMHNNSIELTLRVVPAHIFVGTGDETGFFIRPEDIDLYEGLIDVLELGDEVDLKVYKEDKFWFGDLREIITGLNTPIESPTILPIWGQVRLNCGRRCKHGGDCTICRDTLQVSKTILDKGLYFSKAAE